MIEVKRLSGKLNRDDSYYALPPEDYVDAQNITHDAIEGSNDLVITNIVSNREVNNPYIIKRYSEDTSGYNFVAIVNDNNNGTQTVTFTFDALPAPPVTALTLSYSLDGVTWNNNTGGYTSPQSITIPTGNYQYRVTLEPGIATYNLTQDTNEGRNLTIGAYANQTRNTIIFFNWNYWGYHSVLEYDNNTRTISKIFLNFIDSAVDVLGFTENDKISSINVFNRDEGDLLFFIDSLGRPTFMDINAMKANVYNPVTRELIDVAKRQPLIPPATVYGNDNTRRVNYLRNRFFRFKYRFVYDADFKSTCSPISEVLVPVGILDDTINNNPEKNNIITLSLYSGLKDVKAIEVLMSYVEKTNDWSDFQIVTTINKADNSIADDTFFSYIFDNDSTYPNLDIRESILLFDTVPLKANCQELLNGNVLGYGGITEGYDKDLVPNVVTTVSQYQLTNPTSGSLNGVLNIILDSATQIFTETFTGIPAVGTLVVLKVQQVDNSNIYTAATYTTVSGDSQTSVVAALKASADSLGQVFSANASGNVLGITTNSPFSPKRIFYSLEITPPTSPTTSDSTPVWAWSTERRVGIAYYDNTGRTNGILYNTKVTFKPYENDISGNTFFSQVDMAIYHRPPIWAYSFQFLFTKENTYYLFIPTTSVNTSEADYIYFEITSLNANQIQFPTTTNVLSYKFEDGDRLRLIQPLGVNVYFGDNFDAQILGDLTDPIINGVPQTGKRFLKIKKVLPFQNSTFTQTGYVIQVYRPQQQNASGANETYYECGRQYNVLNPGTLNRVHSGEFTNQSVNLVTPATFTFKKGDAYFRLRKMALSQSGTASFSTIDRNIVDTMISAVNSIDGRPNLIDINAKQAYYGSTIRHGQAYQANTNINGLNRFYPSDFIDVDYSYGGVQRLKTRDRFVRVFQELKTGMVPLFNKISKSPTGDEIVINTNTLLNPIQYYVGDWGIGTARESLASFNFADYFCDNNRGAICRVSNDGVTPLSILYKMNNWANTEIAARKGNYKIYGTFDQRQSNYIIALTVAPGLEPQTLSFDEERNGFDSFLGYNPEMMVSLNTLLCTFKDGVLWTHDDEPYYNNFYGVQQDSLITPVFNDKALLKKTFISLTEVSSQVWTAELINTNINSYGTVKQESNLIADDFALLEGEYSASFLRDINSQGGIIDGDTLKGNWILVRLRAKSENPPDNKLFSLNMLSLKYIESPLNNR